MEGVRAWVEPLGEEELLLLLLLEVLEEERGEELLALLLLLEVLEEERGEELLLLLGEAKLLLLLMTPSLYITMENTRHFHLLIQPPTGALPLCTDSAHYSHTDGYTQAHSTLLTPVLCCLLQRTCS